MTLNPMQAAVARQNAAVGPLTSEETGGPIEHLADAILALATASETCFEVRDSVPGDVARAQVSKALALMLRAHTHLSLAAAAARHAST